VAVHKGAIVESRRLKPEIPRYGVGGQPIEDEVEFEYILRGRIRELGITLGVLPPGPHNAITDVAGVAVGHFTLAAGDDIRTGATAILPHGGNLYQEKVPAGLAVGNGYGKLLGGTQIAELGEIETPVVLTNTLCVPRAAEAILDWTLAQSGNEQVVSVNPVVGECNDAGLNAIRRRALTAAQIATAIATAAGGPVTEGCVGAGTGTVAFGWKGGIGTSSRRLPAALGGWTVGALVQSNFGGVLQIDGLPMGKLLGQYYLQEQLEPLPRANTAGVAAAADTSADADGSIIIVLATDAPLSDRNLARLARRGLAGLARTGAAMSDGSGDYALSFSTAADVRRTPARRASPAPLLELPNAQLSPLFLAAIEATEEAILNSLSTAITTRGFGGATVGALPLDRVAQRGRASFLKGASIILVNP
jgi:D-aminopeptidase